ncbi:MAG: hypothetical protein M3680_11850 [Myxococcota bacterium]|nr:hypothetical protein [Myxococcota bacterium]
MRALVALACVAACSGEPPDRWQYVYATIIAPSCTTSACHSRLSATGGVELHDEATAYRTLTGRGCEDTATPIGGYVDTAMPAASFLSLLLRREGPTGMPPNNRLADDEIELVEAWMARGVPCD